MAASVAAGGNDTLIAIRCPCPYHSQSKRAIEIDTSFLDGEMFIGGTRHHKKENKHQHGIAG